MNFHPVPFVFFLLLGIVTGVLMFGAIGGLLFGILGAGIGAALGSQIVKK